MSKLPPGAPGGDHDITLVGEDLRSLAQGPLILGREPHRILQPLQVLRLSGEVTAASVP